MKKLLPLLFLLALLPLAQAASVDNIYWEPEHPKAGDTVTVYAEITGNVTNATLQYCVGDACWYLPMQYNGATWETQFEAIKGTTELNVSVNNGESYMVREVEVTEKSGTPGFEMVVALGAIAIGLMVKAKTGKRL